MKISPVSAPSNTVAGAEGGSRVDAIRALQMTTNATTSQLDIPQPIPDEKLLIEDNNDTESNLTEEATQPISPQFAALAKQRRALQVKERELREKEKAIEAKLQGSDAVEIARLKSEPLSVLLENGVTYDQLTEAILANQGNSEVNALKAEIEALKEGVEKKFTERDTRAEQQVLNEMRQEANELVNQGDTYELVRATGSVPDVIRLIEMTYRESKEVLDVSEACQLVEDELFARNQKLAGLKKMQSLFAPSQPAPEAQQRQQGMRTLTNKDTASVPMTAKQRALAAFYGTLKK